MGRKITTSDFIREAREIHGDKYDYSKFIYKSAKTKGIIICKEHGEFPQNPNNHLQGTGCKECAIIKNANKRRSNTEEFIKKAIEVHSDKYDYSEVVYVNNHTNVKIFCKKCKEYFYQRPDNHLQDKGCKECAGNVKSTTEEFVKKSIEIHDDKFYYSEVDYVSAVTNVKIYCKKCKEYFYQTPHKHLQGRGCSKCSSSKGEELIRKILEKLNIKFKEQKKFKDCKHKLPLPFDFFIPSKNICIEYNGIQHYEYTPEFFHRDGKHLFEE
jgi:formylmethanofuran dehydrogenase subunit E